MKGGRSVHCPALPHPALLLLPAQPAPLPTRTRDSDEDPSTWDFDRGEYVRPAAAPVRTAKVGADAWAASAMLAARRVAR